MQNFRKEAAQEAVKRIKPNSTIGFGGGATITYLAEYIKEDAALMDSLIAVTSSFTTRQALLRLGFTLHEMQESSQVDLYFDGCDQFDHRLNALKSGGGIHTTEKIMAAMADEFILLGDAAKRVDRLSPNFPLVLEVIPEALAYVSDRVKKFFNPVKLDLRISDKKDGAVFTERGNFLLDCWFSHFPEPIMINDRMISIPGILEHSLFYNMAHAAIVAGPDGIQHFSKIGS